MYTNYLKDNTCFIVPNNLKKEILSYMSSNKLLLDISFYTMDQLKKKMFFDYNERTIYELAKKYNLKYDDAILMIENMYYLSDSRIDDPKVVLLKKMKDYLDKNNLLMYDEMFLSYIKKREIITVYGKNNFIYEKILTDLQSVTYLSNSDDLEKEIYEFDFIEEEVEYVAYKIASLIDSGIDINNIKLVNVRDEYISIIEKIFNFYNIPINLDKKTSLYELNLVKTFIKMLKDNEIDIALNQFKEKYNIDNQINLDIYNKIIDVLNNYYFIENYSEDIDFIIEGFKQAYIKEKKLDNCIECLSIEDITDEKKYYFLIGFNNRFPTFLKDEDYLSDMTKVSLGFNNSYEINKNIKRYCIDKINGAKNLIITYKLKDYFNSYLVSTLIDDIKGNVSRNPSLNTMISYSSRYDMIKLSKGLDEFYKFSYKSPSLSILYNNYGKENYDSYDNSFKGIEKNKYIEMKDNHITLSYSNLDEFYKCSFKYYLNNLLQESDDTFAIYIGTLYHEVLSKIYDIDFDFEKVYSECLNARVLTNKEKILLIKLKEELKRDIVLLQQQSKNSDFNKGICERKLEIPIKSKISVTLKGFIDKIMISKNNKYAYVVDYKTGKPKISFDNLKNGLNMQLAIYMYLMSKSKDYADIFLVGCYLQKILDDDSNKEELKLEGYTFNDLATIKLIDHNCFDKSFISGIKVKKDGTLSDSKKVFDSTYYMEVLEIVEEKIEEAINSILDGDFRINPKIVEGENISCKFCNYKDICYRKYKDNVVISQAGDEDE